MIRKIINFIAESKSELMKVNWPTKQQTLNYTLIVIVVSLVVAFYLGGLDYVFSAILKRFI